MALSNKLRGYLNTMNTSAKQSALGTLIQNLLSGVGIDLSAGNVLVGDASNVSSAVDIKAGGNILQGNDTIAEALDASGDAKILIGNATKLASVAVSGDATISNAGVVAIGAGKVEPAMMDYDEVNLDLTAKPFQFAGVKTDGNIEDWIGPEGVLFQCLNIGDKTAVSTWVRGTGIEPTIDNTDNEGCEISLDGYASGARASFVAGTDDFFVEAKITVGDVSELDEVYIGLRKAEAFEAIFDNYDEAVAINCDNGGIGIESILNAGATADTDTTDTITDGQYMIARIEHKNSVGLSSAIALAADVETQFAAHLADAAMHTTDVDAVNVITAPTPTTLPELITFVDDMVVQYDAHEGDSELGAAWVYHAAQETGDDSLASTAAVTDLPECIAMLNDFKAKFNLHENDATSHAAQDNNVLTADLASSCTFTTGVNAALAAPSVTAQFTFDDAEEVMPFIRILKDAGSAATTAISSFKCGRL